MKLNKAVLLAFLSSALLASGAYADDNGKKGKRDRGFGASNPGMIIKRMTRHLDLDDAQHDSVKNIIEAAKPEMQALREKSRANRDALQALTANDAGVQNLAIANGELATEATLLFARVRSDVDAVLTDEQRAKLAELVSRRGDREGRRRNRN